MIPTFWLNLLRVAAVGVALVAAWSVWVRRITVRSRFDAGTTAAVALFGLGALLDAPSTELATTFHSLTGRFYVMTLIAHLCYLGGAAAGISSVWMRLLPDDEYRRFMRRRIVPFVAAVGLLMTLCFLASAAPRTQATEHLYFVVPDRWLVAYLLLHFANGVALGGVAVYGVLELRNDPRSVKLNLMAGSLVLAAAGGVVMAWGTIGHRMTALHAMIWLSIFAAFAGGSIAAAAQWRHRVRQLTTPPG